MTIGISPSLQPYLPLNLLQPDGKLKAGVSPAEATKVAEGIQAKAAMLPPAQAALFLQIARGSDIAPEGKIPANLGASLDRFAAAASAVTTLSSSTTSLNFLARVMIEQAGEQRKSALQDRLSARETAKAELMLQAQSMKDEAATLTSSAHDAMVASVVASSISIAAGALSVAGGLGAASKGAQAGAAAKESMKAANTKVLSEGGTQIFTKAEVLKGASQAMADNKGAKMLGSLAGGANTIGQGTGQIGQGVSGYVSTTGQADAKNIEALGATNAAEAQNQQATGDLRKEQQQAIEGMMQSIIQFLKDMQDSKAQQMQALTRV